MRFYTVPSSKEARKSVEWAIWLIGIFYLFTLVLGYGAAALVGPKVIAAAPGKANSAAPLLAYELGGELLLGIISAVAFATILAVVAGLTITASASLVARHLQLRHQGGHRLPGGRGPGRPHHRGRHRHLSPSSAASSPTGRTSRSSWPSPSPSRRRANLPTILYSLFWKRFNTRGALWSHLRRADHARIDADRLQPGRVRQAGRPGHRQVAVDAAGRSTSTGSRWTTPASSRSRWPSSSAGSAR